MARAASLPSAAPASAAASAAVRAWARATAAPPILPSPKAAAPAATTSTASNGATEPRSRRHISCLLGRVRPRGGKGRVGAPARADRALLGQLLLGREDGCHRGDGLAGVEVHHLDAGGVAALRGDLAHRGTDGGATRGEQEDLGVEGDHEGGDDVAALGRELYALDAHGAPALARKAVELGALAVAGGGDDQDGHVVARHVTRHHHVAGPKAHADDALGGAARRTHRVLREADRLAVARHHEDVVGAAGLDDAHQLVAVLEVDGDEALAPRLVVLVEAGLLHLPALGGEEQEPAG